MEKYAVDIKWDTDGDKALFERLPQEICIDEVCSIFDGTDEQHEEISNFITEKTGFCHFGYNVVIK